ncbi:MAG: ABC-F family ATP-binding cassette domain-containing protein [Bacteroidales bacterium]
MASILQAQKLSKRYGTKVLFEELDLNINEGEKVALIAPNGTGKSSLLNIIAGKEAPDMNANGEAGTVQIFCNDGIAYLEQVPTFDLNKTVFEEVFSGGEEVAAAVAHYERALISQNQKKLEEAMHEMDRVEGWQYEQKIKQVLSGLKIENLDQKMKELSGGQKKRIALAKMMINEAGFIIMDEPTNHLDLEIIEYLEEYLKRSRISILMVTHDRYFLDRVCNKIVELESGQLYTYNGNYSYFLERREERVESFNTETERAKNLFKTELDWMRRMPQARGTKAKYRINAFYDLKERATQKVSNDTIKIDTASARLGTKIINCKKVSHNYDNFITIDNFTYNFSRGEKIGLVGPNGVGKTTFLEVITGAIPFTKGEIEQGETVVFGYYRQKGMEFNPNDTVIDAVQNIAEVVTMSDGSVINVSQFLARFLFPHSTHNTKIEKLSGGEKRRLYLVTVLMQNPNFLILDEPTNDLDLMTLNILEEHLNSFPGCVIIVSHDRYFLDKIAHHLFIFEGEGVIKDYVGKYSEYREMVKEAEKLSIAKERLSVAKGDSSSSKEKLSNQKRSTSGKEQINRSKTESHTQEKRKLSYKEKKELESVEKKLGELSKEKSSLEAALNSGTLSPEKLTENSNRFALLIEEVETLENRWLELSEISE